MIATTVLLVSVEYWATTRFEAVFRELGVVLAPVTLWALHPMTHVVVGVLLLGVCALRLAVRGRSWSTHLWLAALLLYTGFVIVGMFTPFLREIEVLGPEAAAQR